MSSTVCVTHPGAAAGFRCDGCGALLCEACVETGHRLLFCRRCGERALPLAGTAASVEVAAGTIMERRRERIVRAAAGYGLGDALLYPVRGSNAGTFWVFVLVLVALDLVGSVVGLGLAAFAAAGLVWLLVPRFLFSVANHTAQGRDELPDWPDLDVWELFRTALLFAFTTAVCLLPGFLLLRLAGFNLTGLWTGEQSFAAFLLLLALGCVLAVALWVPAFGAVALYDTFMAALRLDLHARALAVAPGEAAAITAVLAGLLFVGTAVRLLLAFLPLVGAVLSTAVLAYTLFTGAHLVGVYFRRRWTALEDVYQG